MAYKIAFVYNTAAYLLRFRRQMLETLLARGAEIIAIVPIDDRASAVLTRMGVRCLDLTLADQKLSVVGDIRTFLSLYKIFRGERPDAVIAFTAKPIVYGSIAARLAGVPRIISMITGLGYVFSGTTPKHLVLQKILGLQYCVALRLNCRVFFQNPDDMSHFVIRGCVKADKATLTNGSGVDLEEFRPSSDKSETPVFLMSARLIWEKGVGEYVAAARSVKQQYPDAQFWVLGQFDLSPSAVSRTQIADWEAEDVIRYLGFVEDVRPYLNRAHVFVLPSYYREGIPRTLIEALASGLPVITTNSIGCRETVVSGVNGFLVEPRDAEELAVSMKKFLADLSLAKRMGKEARRFAEAKFDVQAVTDAIVTALTSDDARDS
jgi:glycosyltransferase involved in cell wall biosynthesis